MSRSFPPEWLDELRARADIVQIVSARVPLKKDGARYWGLCPFHNEKTASFTVSTDMNRYYCFGCKANGDAIDFLREMERLTFPEAVERLAAMAHMPLPDDRPDPEAEKRRGMKARIFKVNLEAARYYHAALFSDEGLRALEYLRRRGLTDSVIRRFGLGAAGARWDGLTTHLLELGFSMDDLTLAGVTLVKEKRTFDMFRDRAIFPIINMTGDVLGFGGRALGDVQPKYLNTAETPAFNKRLNVYAVNLLRKQRGLTRLILCEGYMDVVAMEQFGVKGAVATLGTALTAEQARLMKRFAPEIWIAYDGDSAGQHAAMRALDIMEAEKIPARVLVFPDQLDPDEFLRRDGAAGMEALKPLSPTAYRLASLKQGFDLGDPDGRAEYAKAAAVILGRVREPVELERYLEMVSLHSGFSRETLLKQIGAVPPPTHDTSRPRETYRPKRAPADDVPAAERTLVLLAARGQLSLDRVDAESFTNAAMRALFEGLCAGRPLAALIADMEDDAERETMSRAMSEATLSAGGDAARTAEDCIRAVRVRRLEAEREQLSNQIDYENAEAVTRAAARIQQLDNEIQRLKSV